MSRQQTRNLLREKEHGEKDSYSYPKDDDAGDAPPPAGFPSAIKLHEADDQQRGGCSQKPRPQDREDSTGSHRAESGEDRQRETACERTDGAQDRCQRRRPGLPLLLNLRCVHHHFSLIILGTRHGMRESKSSSAGPLPSNWLLSRMMNLRSRDPKARSCQPLPASKPVTEFRQACPRESPPPTDSIPTCRELPNYVLPRFGRG